MSKRKTGFLLGVIVYTSLSILLNLVSAFSQQVGDKTLEEVMLSQALNEDRLFQIPGVNGVGIGRDENERWVLHVYVKEEAIVELIPRIIDGVDVVLIASADFYALDTCSPSGPCSHRNAFSFPVPGGISTSNHLSCRSNTGTRGFKVCDATDINIVGYITNNHVAAAGSNRCPNGAPLGTAQYQPGTDDVPLCTDGSLIGTLERFVNISFVTDNVVDAAFVRSDNATVSDSIWDLGIPTGVTRVPGMELVRKSGRTTGLTEGTVQSINFSGPVAYTGCGTAQFVGQIVITPGSFSTGGDSGSPVLDTLNNPIGLLFAGSDFQTIVNPIQEVTSRLNVQFNCIASGAAAVSRAANLLDVFIRGTDNVLYHKAFDGTSWSGWEARGGTLTSAPAAASWGLNRLDVFVRGTDNAIWQTTWNGSTWSGFQSLGGAATSAPAAVSWGVNRLDVFIRGLDGGLWHNFGDGTSWIGWESLGGSLTSAPAVASRGANLLDVFVRSTDGGIWQRTWNGSSWSGWQSLGGAATSAPAASSWGTNRLDVFIRSIDNAIWHNVWNGISWSGWFESLGGVSTSAPAAASWGVNRLDAFVRGTDSNLYQNAWNGSSWSGWVSLGCCMSDAPDP